MNTQKEIAIDRALTLLKAVGYEYAVKFPDGTLITNGLDVVEKKRRKVRKEMNKPMGTYTKVLRDHGFEAMEIGDEIFFPKEYFTKNDLEIRSMQSSCTALASKIFGSGVIKATVPREGERAGGLEIFRGVGSLEIGGE
jgi:hypothetical protein